MLGLILEEVAAGPGMLGMLLPLIIMFVVFYFFLIRPQQKRQKEVRDMQDGLKKGDSIVTIGGIHGVVDTLDEDSGTIVITTGSGQLTFDRNSVRDVKKDDDVKQDD